MENERLLNAQEISVLTGISLKTLDMWYMWKRKHPEHELAQMLPDYVQEGNRNKRFWKPNAVYELCEFRLALPHGRNGVMGDVTQKYIRRRKEKEKTK